MVDNHLLPQAPTGLTAGYLSFTELALTWNKNSEGDLSHYRIYRVMTADGPIDTEDEEQQLDLYVEDDDNADPQNLYIDAGITTQTATSEYWTYAMEAVDKAGNVSPLSKELKVPPPDAPGDLEAIGRTERVDLSWTPVLDGFVAGYEIFRQDGGSGSFSSIGNCPVRRPIPTKTQTSQMGRDTTITWSPSMERTI